MNKCKCKCKITQLKRIVFSFVGSSSFYFFLTVSENLPPWLLINHLFPPQILTKQLCGASGVYGVLAQWPVGRAAEQDVGHVTDLLLRFSVQDDLWRSKSVEIHVQVLCITKHTISENPWISLLQWNKTPILFLQWHANVSVLGDVPVRTVATVSAMDKHYMGRSSVLQVSLCQMPQWLWLAKPRLSAPTLMPRVSSRLMDCAPAHRPEWS